jgi:ankyrin repeat protein
MAALSEDAALLSAAREGDVAAVRAACEAGANATCAAEDGTTPLHAAAEAGHAGVLQLLLQERGAAAGVNAKDARGRTPLLRAALNRPAWPREAMLLLLEHGADAGAHANGERGGHTPLHAAIEAKDAALCSRMLAASPGSVHALGDKHLSPLQTAARCGAAECMALLLEAGADVHASHARLDGWTALHMAACVHAEECIALLLARGADACACDSFGDLAADKWLWGGPDADVFKGIASLNVRNTARLATLLADATRPDADLSAGPLRLVAAKVAEDLVLAGMRAISAGDTDALALLLDGGLAASAKDKRPGERGTTLLQLAAGLGQVPALRLLLARGADVQAANANGVTPLHVAADAGHTEAMRVLLDAGACADAADKDGETPLYWAAFTGQADAMALLLDRGAAAGVASSTGSTALDVATRFERSAAVALLLQRGATPSEEAKRPPPAQTRRWLAAASCGGSVQAAGASMVAWLHGLREGRGVCRACL